MASFGEEGSLPLARQQDYDALVKDFMESDGMSIQEAADEAL